MTIDGRAFQRLMDAALARLDGIDDTEPVDAIQRDIDEANRLLDVAGRLLATIQARRREVQWPHVSNN